MEAPSRTKSRGPTTLHTHFQRSASPSGRFCSSSISSSSSVSSFSTRPDMFMTRPTSPTRVNIPGSKPPSSSSSVRFSIDRPTSPGRSIAVQNKRWTTTPPSSGQKKTCMCSPTTHPGSFRCSLHKNGSNRRSNSTVSYHGHRLNARRSAMTNSLVRIGTVEGDLVRRALAALIRPSSHQQKRRGDFQPRPSRLSRMSKAGDGDY